MTYNCTITSLNERTVLVSFGNTIDEKINGRIIALHRLLQTKSFQGFLESVPAYASLAVLYEPLVALTQRGSHHHTFDWVKDQLENLLLNNSLDEAEEGSIIEIPVLYDGGDLEFVATQHRLRADEVAAIHSSKTYRVFMIGFLPGFPYLGPVDERIATPRRDTPRVNVQPGSVGIAGLQTGIYPQQSPGGWQLIGRTPIKIFDRRKTTPCLFKPGDSVRFFAIGRYEFERRNEYRNN